MDRPIKPIELITDYKDAMQINLQVSTVCNYTCDYCFPGANDGKYPFRKDWKQIADNFTALFNHYKKTINKNKFHLVLTGGEPTLWPRLENFCEEIKKENNVIIHVITNGSRTIRWWEEYGHLLDKVVISCHWKEVDVDHLMKVADLLYQKGVVVTVQVLVDPLAWDKCLDNIERLKNSKCKWSIGIQKLENTEYTQEQIDFLKKSTIRKSTLFDDLKNRKKNLDKQPIAIFPDNSKRKLFANEVSLYGWNNFYGWNCNLGVDTLFIQPSGDVTGTCYQKLYNMDTFFNIFDPAFAETFSPEIAPIICKSIYCGCVTEFNMSKSKT